MEEMSVKQRVVAALCEVMPDLEKEAVDVSASFQDLGMDSMDIYFFALKLEESYGLDIEDNILESIKNPEDFVKYLEQNL